MAYFVTLGTFDGVHRGHQKLIQTLRKEAKKSGLKSLIFIFSNPPRSFFNPNLQIPLLTLPQERVSLLKKYGINKICLQP
ncbi:MAG: adenylyltransferase/cytidyltransferase family protein, partial [Elusimicrobia bacterium]|nr:adenylyltransferase/cytidyltransferase family protein [Elusimicrobiota bacterium]